jgi:hypothetical protein
LDFCLEEQGVFSGIHKSQSMTGQYEASRHPYFPRVSRIGKAGYTGWLLFVVIGGLPIVAIPSLRDRLSERIFTLKAAISGEIMPATAPVGANPGGFPKEYETPEPAAFSPFSPAPGERKTYTLIAPGLIAPEIRKVPKRMRILEVPSGESLGMLLPPETPAAPAVSKTPDPEIQFRQGTGEKDAYNLLMRSSTSISGLVRGSNPSLHFVSWGAMQKGEDVYWVRLKFQSEETPGEVDYIWEVKLQTSEVIPLSYNAKSVD